LIDDDQDNLIDCEDDDCATVATCQDSCLGTIALTLPAYDFGSTMGRPATLAPSCHSNSGSEVVFSFVAAADATYAVAINSFLGSMALSVRSDCASAASEIACSATASFSQTVNVQATQGSTYFIIVDAPSGQSDDFDITVEQTL